MNALETYTELVAGYRVHYTRKWSDACRRYIYAWEALENAGSNLFAAEIVLMGAEYNLGGARDAVRLKLKEMAR